MNTPNKASTPEAVTLPSSWVAPCKSPATALLTNHYADVDVYCTGELDGATYVAHSGRGEHKGQLCVTVERDDAPMPLTIAYKNPLQFLATTAGVPLATRVDLVNLTSGGVIGGGEMTVPPCHGHVYAVVRVKVSGMPRLHPDVVAEVISSAAITHSEAWLGSCQSTLPLVLNTEYGEIQLGYCDIEDVTNAEEISGVLIDELDVQGQVAHEQWYDQSLNKIPSATGEPVRAFVESLAESPGRFGVFPFVDKALPTTIQELPALILDAIPTELTREHVLEIFSSVTNRPPDEYADWSVERLAQAMFDDSGVLFDSVAIVPESAFEMVRVISASENEILNSGLRFNPDLRPCSHFAAVLKTVAAKIIQFPAADARKHCDDEEFR
jgi:hypothetical protein